MLVGLPSCQQSMLMASESGLDQLLSQLDGRKQGGVLSWASNGNMF